MGGATDGRGKVALSEGNGTMGGGEDGQEIMRDGGGGEDGKKMIDSGTGGKTEKTGENGKKIVSKVLIIGGGIAGIQSALDLAESGFKVYLLDKSPSIGGTMPQLDKTFPTNDCSMCILSPKLVDAGRHPNIELLTYSEVMSAEGGAGNFKVKIKIKPRYVDAEKCTGCGVCTQNCPVIALPRLREPVSVRLEMDDKDIEQVESITGKYRGEQDLVPILQDINALYNYLPEQALRLVSEELEVPMGQVYHVATFYKSFSLEPRGRHHIRVCMGTACHVRGAPRVLDAIQRNLGIEPGQTSSDGEYSLETVACLGACAMGPVVVVDEEYHSTTPSKVEALLEQVQNMEEVTEE